MVSGVSFNCRAFPAGDTPGTHKFVAACGGIRRHKQEKSTISEVGHDMAEDGIVMKRFCKPKVGGSIPSGGTSLPGALCQSKAVVPVAPEC